LPVSESDETGCSAQTGWPAIKSKETGLSTNTEESGWPAGAARKSGWLAGTAKEIDWLAGAVRESGFSIVDAINNQQ
jgi:hypothetical protein